MDLDARHPVWSRLAKRWTMEQDFLRSGIDVLSPEEYQEKLLFAAVSKPDEFNSDLELDTVEQTFSWNSSRENSYIFTHERERYNHWKTRQQRAFHFPILKSILEIYREGVCKSDPLRDGQSGYSHLSPRWSNIFENASGDFNPFDLLRDETSLIGSATGICYTYLEYEGPEEAPASEAHRIALGNRTYLHLINPISVINWSEDTRGRYRWMVIAESGDDASSPGDDIGHVEQRRVLTPDKTIIYRRDSSDDGNEEWKVHQTIETNAGFVPVVAYRSNIRRNSRGFRVSDPFIPGLVDADRSIYNKMSLLDQIDNNQTFSILAIPRQGAVTGVELSVFQAIGFDGNAGSPQFISPDAAVASGLWNRIKEQIQSIRMLSGVSRGLGEYSKESRSGSAITLESDEKYTKMVSMAQSVERWENDVLSMVAKLEGLEPIEVKYQKKFDVMALESKIDSMLKLVEAGVDEKSTAIIAKTVVKELLKRSGANDDEVREATENLSMRSMQKAESSGDGPPRVEQLPEDGGQGEA